MSRNLLWRPGHSAASLRAAANSRLVPLVPVGSAPVTASTVTSGTADYGAWVELAATTTEDWWGFSILNPSTTSSTLHTAGATNPALLDIGVGAAASEAAIIAGVDISHRDVERSRVLLVDCPYLFVPKGSRVAARISSSTATQTVPLAVLGYKPADPSRRQATIGKATAFVAPSSQRGVPITAGTSWTEIVSATPQAVDALVLGIGGNDTNMANGSRVFDLAFGGSGAETQVWSTTVGFSTNEQVFVASTFVPLRVPAGTRIAARCTSENTSLTVHGLS